MLVPLEKGKGRPIFQVRCWKCGKMELIKFRIDGQKPSIIKEEGWTWDKINLWMCPACTKIATYNPDAIQELIKAAKSLATYPPVAYDHGRDQSYCVNCGTSIAVASRGDLLDESIHTEDCSWRLLKEAVANLDNEGYITEETS